MNDKILTLLIAISIPVGCCLVLLGLTGDPLGRDINDQAVKDIEVSGKTDVIKTKNNTVSYTHSNGEVYTVHISDQAWEDIDKKEKERIIKKIANNTSREYNKIIGVTSGMKVLFTYEGDKNDYLIKFQ